MKNNNVPPRLAPEALCRRCDPEALGFATTADIDDPDIAVGQQRAVAALDLGTRIRGDGFNVFVLGAPGSHRHAVVQELLHGRALPSGTPRDWCYVNNFDDPRKPLALPLPPGRGAALRRDMSKLIDELRESIPAALESEHYRNAVAEIDRELEDRHREAMEPLQDDAKGAKQPVRHKERRGRIRELTRAVTEVAAGPLLDEMKRAYAELEHVIRFLDAVREDVLANAALFLPTGQTPSPVPAGANAGRPELGRYEVNLVVDHSDDQPAPVVYEQHPTLKNLLGRIEHAAHMGALITNFTMIRPGALHRACGGFLILDADRVLTEPLAWSALKRALFAKEVRIESAAEMLSPVATVSLEPQPIPLDVKVVVIGDRFVHYLLCELDPDFPDLFKVAADFENRIDWNDANAQLYGRLIGSIARRENLLPLSAPAVARVVEHASRLIADSEKLTTRIRDVADLLTESSFWAADTGARLVEREHVQRAIDAQTYRADRLREEFQEEIERNDLLIDTSGARIGQVNGLSVFGFGSFSFGQPTRITANVRMGDGQVIDIEREIELGGAIHTKGVLILSAYLGSKYAADVPLSVTANLVFEQSYGGVEGDSASVAETCALLSALAELPIRQSLAVTGSVNQHGQVQVIGGVNEKIEGFFDTCARRGLTSEQGVLIPKDNVKHLMLRGDVVEAVRENRFHVYPISTIDEAIALLTGVPAGRRSARGTFRRGTVNERIERRLHEFAEKREEVSQQILGKARKSGKKGKTGK